MPNHVTTILQYDNEEITKALLDDEGEIDFNRLVPFPDDLKNIQNGYKLFTTDHEAEAYNKEMRAKIDPDSPWVKMSGENQDTIYALSYGQEADLKRQYGAAEWYDWNIQNWGTKWNGYDVDRERMFGEGSFKRVLQFDTAWSHPEPVIQALSAKFPDEIIRVDFADEDLGCNFGTYIIRAGKIQSILRQDGMGDEDENLDFCTLVKYGQSYAEMRAEWDED